MKFKIVKAVALILAMISLLCFPVPASAISQGTDGTALEVMQPQNLEIQLGAAWAGVAFELKTDAGIYPGVITVGEDGILRLEIGGSENYILSCQDSSVQIPEPVETVPAEEVTDPDVEPSEEIAATEETGDTENIPEAMIPTETEQGTVAGIPVAHIAIFGGGLILAIGALIGINFYQKRNSKSAGADEYDDDI